jgi:hypothetical protein
MLNNINGFYINRSWTNGDATMRAADGVLLFWAILEYCKPQRAVEVGFEAGQTFSILVDAGVPDLTSVEIKYDNKAAFDKLYPEQSHITFMEGDSRNAEYSGIYDFVHIDGNHNYEYVLADLTKLIKHVDKNSIIVMDDFLLPGVLQVIDEQLLGQNEFVPFMVDGQSAYFHHETHDISEFLDDVLMGISYHYNELAAFHQIQYQGHAVLKVSLPAVFSSFKNDIFRRAVKFLDV